MFEQLAQGILFSQRSSTNAAQFQEDLTKVGLEYRKGKTFSDIVTAVQKGVRAGRGRTEHEINMVAVYLGTLLKKVRK